MIVVITVTFVVVVCAVVISHLVLVNCPKYISYTFGKCHSLEPTWLQFTIVHFPIMICSCMRDVGFGAVGMFPYCYLIIYPPDMLTLLVVEEMKDQHSVLNPATAHTSTTKSVAE